MEFLPKPSDVIFFISNNEAMFGLFFALTSKN
jgi:hypothetical protein